MNILDHSTSPAKKQSIEYFTHLVRIALTDDIMTNAELVLLHRIGRKLGFTEPEIANLIETTGQTNYIPPYELSKRFEQVFEVVKLTLADGEMEPGEMRLASNFASKSGFDDTEIPQLLELLMEGIKQGKDEDDLFEEYRIKRKAW